MTNIDMPEGAAFLTGSAVLASISEFPISLSTLNRLTGRGQFPAPVRIGGRFFWHPAAVAEWKRARLEEAITPSANSQPKE